MFTTQFHVKEQGAAKPIHGRRRRQDESVSKKVLDIDRRFIDVTLWLFFLSNLNHRVTENTEVAQRRGPSDLLCKAPSHIRSSAFLS